VSAESKVPHNCLVYLAGRCGRGEEVMLKIREAFECQSSVPEYCEKK